MRGFLGITGHFMELHNSTPSLQSVLLACERFTGSHTDGTALRLVEAVTDLDPQSLNSLLESQGHKGLCLSAREWGQLQELVEVLAPFLQATDLTQGEKVVTLSAALPCVLSLNSHLTRMLTATHHLVGLVKALQTSIQRRFQGIFVNVKMDSSHDPAVHLPFGDIVYMMSALLDPSFCLFWLEQDVEAPDEVKSEVKEMIIDLVLAEAQRVTVRHSSSGDDDQEESPPTKTPRLFSGYRKKHTKKSMDHGSSVKAELIRYIQVSSDEDGVDCFEIVRSISSCLFFIPDIRKLNITKDTLLLN
ncbi:uncharacterized protein LOC122145016 [Scomber scombrus]|uniref:Uncharacterized protein LOC122145016 n=1 Tax=Scomber scombrus TaxID=13677 RepID=A0AAV1QIB2_SCOSC